MLVRFLVSAAALAFATWVVPGISMTNPEPQNQLLGILGVAVIFGIVNSVVKPLFQFAAAPLVLITLGLFLMVINGLLLMFTSWLAGMLNFGWKVDGFGSAFWGALIVSVVSFILNAFFTSKSDVNR
jgi:putative membrane protein